ncbi:DNA protecting protein DprA [Terasakiispira papahanaumokuakeensis]|uniref:DNA protecting protein DprA n=1 Tax=Terasakiispira papahanaumokuakeensis TaxID=197479 RepID=A0A1E2VBU8_9GAMM|nr:DNA-processing protein DprA [Terasakiispira papahanaumokuakeensis]ODC04478.1 DNA protecting protein DprA [Terasakiispira papahanaumokuakeensis]
MPLPSDVAMLADAIALWRLPGFSGRRFQQLLELEADATPRQRLAILAQGAAGVPFKTQQAARTWLAMPERSPLWPLVETHLHWAEGPLHWLLPFHQLPQTLQHIPDPPRLLCLVGRCEAIEGPSIALVGTRQPTHAGRQLAHQFGAELGAAGFSIISGLALGVDAAAHRGALDAKAATVGVLASGVDRCYPRSHRALADQIVDTGGALLSEAPLGAPPRREMFPVRNRIVTGLALGVVVIEAAERSGSLVSARLAAEQGREVYALPGPVLQGQSAGCHQLIRQGAQLVTAPDQVVADLADWHQPHLSPPVAVDVDKRSFHTTPTAMLRPEVTMPALPEPLLQVWSCLSGTPIPADLLQSQLSLGMADLQARLMQLELEGLITAQPGGWVRS